MICLRTPGQRLSWKVCFIRLFIYSFIDSFAPSLNADHKVCDTGQVLGIQPCPAPASVVEMPTTNDNYTPVWISTMLGEVCSALEASGESVNFVGGGSRKAETPKDEKKRAISWYVCSIKYEGK